MLELLEARRGESSAELLVHLEHCPRCRVFYEQAAGWELEDQPIRELPQGPVTTAETAPDDIRTGQLWEAFVIDGWHRVVAVIGRSATPDTVVVAPVSPELAMAA